MTDELRSRVVNELVNARRALPNSPDGYTPSRVSCPSPRPSVRSAASLSSNESSWLRQRRENTVPAIKKFLTNLDIPGFDAGSYFDAHSSNSSALPTIGIATSGGGWRALLVGAGVIQALDSRTNSGRLGGLLQSSTYLAGLSGGSWLVGSIAINNWTSVTALRDNTGGSVWEFGNSILKGPDEGGIQLLDSADYYTTLIAEVEGKSHAGFETTLTDLWGRALSFQLINATDGGPAYTWSSIALADHFQDGKTPFPIVIADERAPGEVLIPGNTTIYVSGHLSSLCQCRPGCLRFLAQSIFAKVCGCTSRVFRASDVVQAGFRRFSDGLMIIFVRALPEEKLLLWEISD